MYPEVLESRPFDQLNVAQREHWYPLHVPV